MSKTKGLHFEMKQWVKNHCKNATSRKGYLKHASYFCNFVKACGIPSNDVRLNPLPALQAYADKLLADGKSSDTIHTYLSQPCGFFGVCMDEIKKPMRSVRGITKSRGGANGQGQREQNDAKNERLVLFQDKTGLRRAELARVRGNNFKQDESGAWCVEVLRGKGGKYHLQRVLPQDLPFVQSYFDGSTDKLFSPAEMRNKIDLHAMRSAHARRAYEYYRHVCQAPTARKQLQREILLRFQTYNKNTKNPFAVAKFRAELEGTYHTRGNSVTVAKAKGRPLAYDKTALMAVSVFHLSHWRNDVTVCNYMLA